MEESIPSVPESHRFMPLGSQTYLSNHCRWGISPRPEDHYSVTSKEYHNKNICSRIKIHVTVAFSGKTVNLKLEITVTIQSVTGVTERNMKKAMDLIGKYHMIVPGDGIVAGVSGGADSVCLLLVLRELEQAMDLKLHVVHVEHGIRGEESLRDAEYVESLCREMGVDFHCIRADIPALASEWGISAEEA